MACFAGCFDAAAQLATAKPEHLQDLQARVVQPPSQKGMSAPPQKGEDAASDANSTAPPASTVLESVSDAGSAPPASAAQDRASDAGSEVIVVQCPHCNQQYTGEHAERALGLHCKYLHPATDAGLNVGYELVYEFKGHTGVTGAAQRYALQGGVGEK